MTITVQKVFQKFLLTYQRTEDKKNALFIIDFSKSMSSYEKEIKSLVSKFVPNSILIYSDHSFLITKEEFLKNKKPEGKTNLSSVFDILKDDYEEYHLFTDDIPCIGKGCIDSEFVLPAILQEQFQNFAKEKPRFIYLLGFDHEFYHSTEWKVLLINNVDSLENNLQFTPLEFSYNNKIYQSTSYLSFEIVSESKETEFLKEDFELQKKYFINLNPVMKNFFLSVETLVEKEQEDEEDEEKKVIDSYLSRNKIQRISYNILCFLVSRENFMKRLQEGVYDKVLMSRSNCHNECLMKNKKGEITKIIKNKKGIWEFNSDKNFEKYSIIQVVS